MWYAQSCEGLGVFQVGYPHGLWSRFSVAVKVPLEYGQQNTCIYNYIHSCTSEHASVPCLIALRCSACERAGLCYTELNARSLMSTRPATARSDHGEQ